MCSATYTGVFTFGVLTHDHPIELTGFAIAQWRFNAGKNAGRAHVSVLIKALTDFETQAPQRNVIWNVGVTS